jgi:hypothetical protein
MQLAISVRFPDGWQRPLDGATFRLFATDSRIVGEIPGAVVQQWVVLTLLQGQLAEELRHALAREASAIPLPEPVKPGLRHTRGRRLKGREQRAGAV